MTLNKCIPNLRVLLFKYWRRPPSFAAKTVPPFRISPGSHRGMLTRDNAGSISPQRKSPPRPSLDLISHRYKHKSQFTCWRQAGGRFYPPKSEHHNLRSIHQGPTKEISCGTCSPGGLISERHDFFFFYYITE